MLGTGLSGGYNRLLGGGFGGINSGNSGGSSHGYWEDDFFPQFLELQWPPEGRLVERDCTCDFWERIRCKFMLVTVVLVQSFWFNSLLDAD